MNKIKDTIFTHSKALIALLIVLLIMLGAAGWFLKGHTHFGPPPLTEEDAERINATVDDDVVDTYNEVCSAYIMITDGQKAFSALASQSQPDDTTDTIAERTTEVINTQHNHLDDAAHQLDLAAQHAPTDVTYPGQEDTKNFATGVTEVREQFLAAGSHLDDAAHQYATIPTGDTDALTDAQTKAEPHLKSFYESASQTINDFMQTYPATTQATQDKIEQDTHCTPLFEDARWADDAANKQVDNIFIGFVRNLGAARHTILDGTQGIQNASEHPEQFVTNPEQMTIQEGVDLWRPNIQQLIDSLDRARDMLTENEAPTIFYPKDRHVEGLQPVVDRVLMMINHQHDELEGVAAQFDAVTTPQEFEAAQYHFQEVMEGFNRDLFITYRDTSAMLHTPTQATAEQARTMDECNQWCTF